LCNVTPFIPERVGRGVHYGILCATTTDNISKNRNSPVILCTTRESNQRQRRQINVSLKVFN
ncbi:hypothetical protein SFRURICE_002529, partial [Spodoptera frugiperda]